MTELSKRKRALTIEIKQLSEYVADCHDQINRQYPQSNGDIYLHGDVIANKSRETGRVFKRLPLISAERKLARIKQYREALNDTSIF